MFTRKINITRTAIAFALAAGIAMSGTLPAYADDTSLTITGGDLTIATPTADDFDSTELTGAVQTITAGLSAFSVSDARGSGAGWIVTAQASKFTNGTRTIEAASLSMSAPTVSQNATNSPVPDLVAGPHIIDGAQPATIATAAEDEGMGTYNFGATTLALNLPADVYADTYTSIITISVVSAP